MHMYHIRLHVVVVYREKETQYTNTLHNVHHCTQQNDATVVCVHVNMYMYMFTCNLMYMYMEMYMYFQKHVHMYPTIFHTMD